MDRKILQIGVIIVLAIALTGAVTYIATSSVQNSGDDGDIDYYQKITSCTNQIKGMVDFEPTVAIVLGTGCGDFISKVDVVKTIPYSDVKYFPVCTTSSHEGNLVFGTLEGVNLVIMQGRVHYYEGYDMKTVTLPIYVMNQLGAETLILTNAVGSLNSEYRPGNFCVVTDYISSFIPSPLIGKNYEELGPRFPPVNDAYDDGLIEIVKNVAASRPSDEHKITVRESRYVQITGPQYETPTECEAYRNMGADTVGMSSVCECIVGVYLGMKVCNINCVTDMADEEATHEEIEEMMENMAPDLNYLLAGVIKQLGQGI